MSSSGSVVYFDKERTLRGTLSDGEFLKEIAEIFIREYPDNLKDIKDAIDSNDIKSLVYSAHFMKGRLRHFATEPLIDIAKDMEKAARGGEIESAARGFSSLESAVKSLAGSLEEFINE